MSFSDHPIRVLRGLPDSAWSEHFKAVESELSVCGERQSARQSSTGDIAIWVLGEA
ncbi:hypothetical protein QJS04_geneDACA001659 [Acorus gramineus]|uniref:Uncharacterized protein n=1 Tax=Acorus gramineus TaxID=55184 RepID=A0AAV9BI05_ACOGR|nr:hypothetical protein QJS04_geneDACA001659 [Acorus gramineus]